MNRFVRLLFLAALASVLAAAAHAQLRVHGRYAVTEAEVSRAVAKAITGEDSGAALKVTLLTDVSTTESSPQFDVTGMASMQSSSLPGEQKLAVRLTCHPANVCMPFYVIVTGDAVMQAGHQKAMLQQADGIGVKTAPVILRIGSHATLLIDDGSVRLAVPVVSLQNAVAGQRVHVTSIDRKHVYTAEALTPTLLQGSF